MEEGHGRERLEASFGALIDDTQGHFDREEQAMTASGYPEQRQHVEQHQAFKAKVAEVRERQRTVRGNIPTVEKLEFFHDWLIGHIQGTDSKLGEFLRAAGHT